MQKRLEMAANLATLALCCVVAGYVISLHYAAKTPPQQQAQQQPKDLIGKTIRLSGNDFHKTTLVMGLSTKCHFCTDSAPFYARLLQNLRDKNVPVLAVFPQPEFESRAYLDNLKIPPPLVSQAPLSAIFVAGTPTLMIVDEHGVVTDAWIGKLQSSKEEEVFLKLGLQTYQAVAQFQGTKAEREKK